MFAVRADNKRTSQDLKVCQGCERGKKGMRECREREKERKGKRNKKMRLQSHAN